MQGILLGIICLIAWFGIRPLLTTIQIKMDDIQKLSVIREYREKQLERLPELEAQHALISEQKDRLNIILTKERLVDFIETLEQQALADGVTIKIESRDNAFLESKVTIVNEKEKANGSKQPVSGEKETEDSVAPVKKGGGTDKGTGIIAELPLKKFLKLTMTVSGEYGMIIRYLRHLETLPYALDVISLDIKVQPEEGDRVSSGAGTFNPFGELPESVTPPPMPKTDQLDAVLETVVYIQD